MDPKTQMPDIKAEVNKVDDGKKKASGFLGLFGGGGGGAAGGLGGLGAGAAGGGGLLATKAGMLALVLMGSAVAGGIGLAGYKMFGPGDADRTGGNLSLFAPKPAQVSSEEAAPVNADGSSASLGLMAQAAAKDKEPEMPASASADAPTDSTAGDPAKDAAAADAARREAEARAAAGGALNSDGGAGAVGSMKGLANVKKLGALSGGTGGGASTTAGSGSAGKLGDGLASASRNGSTSGFAKSGPGAKASGARGMAARGGRGARAQARNVMGDQAKGRAGSSFAAGRTYDGSATQSGGAIGPDGSAIGMDGVGDGVGAQPKALPANKQAIPEEQEPPAPKPKHMVTPWEKAVQRVQLLAMAAMVLAIVAGKLVGKGEPYTSIARWVIGGILAAMAVYAASLCYQIMTGPNAQKAQGLVALAGAAGIGVLAGMVISGSAAFEPAEMSFENATGLMMLGGGLALISMIGGMFMPKPKQVEVKDGEKTPDISWIETLKNPPDYRV